MTTANEKALASCLTAPCIQYEKTLDRSKFEEAKISDVIDDVKKTKTCPVYDGTTGIEGFEVLSHV